MPSYCLIDRDGHFLNHVRLSGSKVYVTPDSCEALIFAGEMAAVKALDANGGLLRLLGFRVERWQDAAGFALQERSSR